MITVAIFSAIMLGGWRLRQPTRSASLQELIRTSSTAKGSTGSTGAQRRITTGWLIVACGPLAMVHPALPMASALLVVVLRRRRARQRHAQRMTALTKEVRTVVDLLRVATASGLTVQQAIPHLCGPGNAADGELGHGLLQAVHGVATGERFIDGLTRLLANEDRTVFSVHIRPLVSTLLMAERHGTPLAMSLEVLSVELRDVDRRTAEAAARRLPVRMLAPLITLLLPSFALLTVVPLLASGLRALRLGS
jgi:tight adherence protein C